MDESIEIKEENKIEVVYKDIRAGLLKLLSYHFLTFKIFDNLNENDLLVEYCDFLRKHLNYNWGWKINKIESRDEYFYIQVWFEGDDGKDKVIDINVFKNK